MRRDAAIVVLAAVLILSALAPAIVAGDGGGSSSAAARNLTIGELSPGGTKPANAPPSVRQNGAYGEFAVKYLPTGLLVQPGKRYSYRYLRPGQTIRRNEIWLWSKRAYNADEQDWVVWIAHWQKGQETITTADGETRTKQVAQNVTVYKRTVTFGPGYDKATIDLRPHYGGSYRTTMAIARPGAENPLENPGPARWTFYHESSRATIGVQTLSAGGRLAWGIGFLVLPFFLTTVIVLYIGRQFIKRAKAGPHISAIWWVIAAVVFGILLIAAWTWIADTVIRAPYLIPAAFGVFLGLIAVEWYGRRTYGVGFLQFRLTDGYDPTDPAEVREALEDPDGDDLEGDPTDAPGVLKARFMVQRFARGETSDRPSAIRKGLRKFWARARGATADLEVDGNMQTKIETEGPIEELYLLDPDEEEPLEYKPERHEWRLPNLLKYDEDGNLQKVKPVPYILGIGFLGFSWVLGQTATGSGLLGLTVGGFLLAVTKIARPVDGKMFANLAPVHYNHAVASMLTHAKGLGEAKAWDDWFRQYQESEAEKDANVAELEDEGQVSQMEQLFNRYVGKAESAPTREGSADD